MLPRAGQSDVTWTGIGRCKCEGGRKLPKRTIALRSHHPDPIYATSVPQIARQAPNQMSELTQKPARGSETKKRESLSQCKGNAKDEMKDVQNLVAVQESFWSFGGHFISF
eukprot:2549485-Rhodomonas_salina.2